MGEIHVESEAYIFQGDKLVRHSIVELYEKFIILKAPLYPHLQPNLAWDARYVFLSHVTENKMNVCIYLDFDNGKYEKLYVALEDPDYICLKMLTRQYLIRDKSFQREFWVAIMGGIVGYLIGLVLK